MNKKGFTLVELLSVIILLLVIISITIPAVTSVINTSEAVTYDSQVNKILSAAYDFSLKNSEFLPENNTKKYITLSTLQKDGFINTSILNPRNKKNFSNDLVISILNVGSNYKTTNKNSILKGYYLYTIEFEIMKSSQYKENRPIITIEDYGSQSFTSNIDLSNTLDDPAYTAYTYDGKDITDKVTKIIIHNSNVVEKVNTSVAGIYYINYTVVDDKGYSNNLIRSVIIVDHTPPTISVSNVTISTNIEEFDLLEGVNCIDNSEKCDIKTEGKIEFGKQGKYIIKYIATDPTGNTTIKKRVITID